MSWLSNALEINLMMRDVDGNIKMLGIEAHVNALITEGEMAVIAVEVLHKDYQKVRKLDGIILSKNGAESIIRVTRK